MKHVEAILNFCKEHTGKMEISGNMGFKDPAFDLMMRRVGFIDTYAWCALYAEAAWSAPTYEGKSKVMRAITDNFSANAVRTYENFAKDDTGYFSVSQKPKEGDVVIWQKMKSSSPVKNGEWTTGHAGIVVAVHSDGFVSNEGNTNEAGGREGVIVADKSGLTRNALPIVAIPNGLSVLGFISMNL